ncbi:MAG: biopolymer transporter ExbD, partial [Methylobacteriaceae bacterium]|nr:biopolymer transporter ExbD [Methylobacteriaceae bacterium]
TVKSDLSVAIGETPVKRRDLARTLETMPEAGKDTRLFLRADRAVPYGELMQVLELLRHGGFLKVALVALEGVPESANLPPTDPAPAAAPSVAAPPQ